MIRLSPSDAIYEGVIFFRNTLEDYQISVHGTLDIYHNDLRFEFENNVFFYSFSSNTFIYDTLDLPKRITEFKSRKLKEGTHQVIHLSFVFQIGLPGQSRVFQVEGDLKR